MHDALELLDAVRAYYRNAEQQERQAAEGPSDAPGNEWSAVLSCSSRDVE
jgi:hypothetical protein